MELQFDFEQKPTLSTIASIKMTSAPLANERNVEDDVTQPIIIKKSKLAEVKHKLNSTKDSLNKSLNTAKPASLSTIRKPQLTNYALNEANLGVQMGMNPSIFSENDIWCVNIFFRIFINCGFIHLLNKFYSYYLTEHQYAQKKITQRPIDIGRRAPQKTEASSAQKGLFDIRISQKMWSGWKTPGGSKGPIK